jgi:surface antigen
VNTAVLEAFLRSPQATHATVALDEPQQVRIIRGFSNEQGQPCRVVEQTVVINGQRVRATGTVCQQPDGHWTIAR